MTVTRIEVSLVSNIPSPSSEGARCRLPNTNIMLDASWSPVVAGQGLAAQKGKGSQRSYRARSKVNERGDLLTDRSTRSVSIPRKGRGSPDPTGAALISGPNIPKSSRPKKKVAQAMSSSDAALLAPPASVKASAAGASAAAEASKLQSELTAMLHAADEAAANSATKLVILKAEFAAQDKRHAEVLANAHGELAASRAENESLRRTLERKEEEYAEELQRWVVDLNSAHSKKLEAAISAEAAKAACAADAAAAAARREMEAQMTALEERVRRAEAKAAEGSEQALLEC